MPQGVEMVSRKTSARIPTPVGEFQLLFYTTDGNVRESLALVRGEVRGKRDVLVRVHSECFTGDVLASRRCDCGEQLQLALGKIAEAGAGVVIYLRQEGRGIGLLEKLRAYNLQDQGYDTVDANLLLGHGVDERDYAVAAHILKDLGVESIQLLTNNPHKVESLEEAGIEIAGRVSLEVVVNPENAAYLLTKATRMQHLLLGQLHEFPSDHQSLKIVDEIAIPLTAAAEHCRHTGRPFVTLSYAQSLDGSIAARSGRPLALSGSQSMALTHRLRAMHDGILVGIGTVLADNPCLNVRLVEGKDPQPVIVDSRLRFPSYANLLRNGRSPWIITGEGADPERQSVLEAMGAQVFHLPSSNGLLDLVSLLRHLGNMGINSLMVEGGAQIISSFLASRLVDQIVLTIAPLMVGGLRVMEGRPPLKGFPRLRHLSYQRLGEDLVLRGDPDWEA